MRNIDLWGTAPGNNSFRDYLRPSVDPASAIVGGLLTGVSGLFGGGGGSQSAAAAPVAAPPQPAPQAAPQSAPASAQRRQQGQASFIGGVPTPPPSTGQRTLLGQ